MTDDKDREQDALPPSPATQPLSEMPDVLPPGDKERSLPPKRTNVDTLIGKSGQGAAAPETKVAGGVTRDEVDLGDVAKEFEVIETFAEGGQGSIASARDRILKRLVAIKSLKKDLLDDEHQVSGFLAEAGVTAQLDHPSIVPLYALCSDREGGLHLAMKMVNGRTLTAYLNEVARLYREHGLKHFDERQALFTRLEYFMKICEAISYSHSRGILHRDLKSENVMIGEFGEVYVMDWGLALDKESVADCPVEKLRQGTPGYMAPEVIRNRGLTERSDIFSLGAILFEIVTLQRAFQGGSIENVLRNTVAGKSHPVEHRCDGVKLSPDIVAVIKRAMQKDPEQRYASVDALREDVRKFVAGQEVSARPDNAWRVIGRWLFLHKQQSLMLFFGILLLCAGFSIHVLIRKYHAEQTARHRQSVLANLQDDVNAQAHRVDRHILKLEAALRNYAQRAVFLLEHELESTLETGYGFHEYRELQDLDTAPPGTIRSPLYGENVSLDFSTFKWAPGPVPDDGPDLLERLGPLDRGLLQVLVESDPALRFDPAETESFKTQAATEGFPLRFIYIGMPDGLLLCYPGKSRFDDAYDPRLRPWYQQAAEEKHVIWTKPYYDAFGQGLILSASYAVRDAEGEVLGVASLDLTLEYIVNQLIEEGDQSSRLASHRFLLDQDGLIILDSTLENMMDAAMEEELAELQLKRYEHEDVQRFLRSGRGGQIQIDGPDGPVVLACSPISGVNWYFLEEVPLGGLDFAVLARAWEAETERASEY